MSLPVEPDQSGTAVIASEARQSHTDGINLSEIAALPQGILQGAPLLAMNSRTHSYFFNNTPSSPQQDAGHFFTACTAAGSCDSQASTGWLSVAQSQPLSS